MRATTTIMIVGTEREGMEEWKWIETPFGQYFRQSFLLIHLDVCGYIDLAWMEIPLVYGKDGLRVAITSVDSASPHHSFWCDWALTLPVSACSRGRPSHLGRPSLPFSLFISHQRHNRRAQVSTLSIKCTVKIVRQWSDKQNGDNRGWCRCRQKQ